MTRNMNTVQDYLDFLQDTIKDIPKGTIRNKRFVLERLGKFLDKKGTTFKKATDKHMQKYFKTVKSPSTYNMEGTTILKFYRWLYGYEKGIKPKSMKWFTFIGKREIRRQQDPNARENRLMTTEEYHKLLNASRDRFGQYEGLWETYWLSGGRLDEVASMTVGDIKIDGNKVSVTFSRSKTVPRTVPLCEYPHRLIRWLGNHPDRENPNAPLWVNTYKTNKALSTHTIQSVFWNFKQKLEIKKTLSVKSFRISRATKMFSARSKDNGLVFSDPQLADFFGWQVEMVPQRRVQYDIHNKQELLNLVFNGINDTPQTYDLLKLEKELMEKNLTTEIENLKKQMQNQQLIMDELQKLMEQEAERLTPK